MFDISFRPRRRDSLSELAELVEAGEKSQLFRVGSSAICGSVTMPARLREEIREENLKFARDRDIYNVDYFTFANHLLNDVVESEQLNDAYAADAIRFALPFAAHFAWHTKRSLRGDAGVYGERIALLLKHSRAACQWMMEELANERKVGRIEVL